MTLAFAPEGVLRLDPSVGLAEVEIPGHLKQSAPEAVAEHFDSEAEAMFRAYQEAMAEGLGSLALLDADIESPHAPGFGFRAYSDNEITARRADILRKQRMPWLNIPAGVDPWFLKRFPY